MALNVVNLCWQFVLPVLHFFHAHANLKGFLVLLGVLGCISWFGYLVVHDKLPNASVDVSVVSTSSEPEPEPVPEVAGVDFYEEDLDTSDLSNEQIFHSHYTFLTRFELMEGDLKVFVYPAPDADPEIALQIYGEHNTEVYFVKNLLESKFVTKNPDEAKFFFVPFLCQRWSKMGYPRVKAHRVLKDYVHELISKYPYWNRKFGADHFYFACPGLTLIPDAAARFLLKNSIQLVSSQTNYKEYFPHKDIVLPQPGHSDGLPARAFDSRNRIMLNFWSAPSNSEVKDARKSACENDQLGIWREVLNWHYQMEWYRNVFCICPDELQAIGACITASIRMECVPVFWSGYDLPFNWTLDWHSFSVALEERGVSSVKKVLDGKDKAECDRLQRNVADVWRHLQWNLGAKKRDAFHMVMYTLYVRRYVVGY